MRQVSQEFRNAVQRNTSVAVKATLALANGTELDLVNSDFVIGSVSFDEATSSTGSFDIGSAIVGQFKATIANYDGKFSRYDFSGSTITPSVGTVVNGTMEWLQIGVYDIDRPTSTGRSIEIQAYDKLNSMKVALNTVGISYPTTLGDIALKLCDACGVTLESSAFPNNDYQVKDAPRLVDSDTCLSGIAWVAQIACCYVKCSNLGHIVFDWYDPADFKDAANLDGGTFNTSTVPYSDGDAADGGTFDDYSSGAKVDAGGFSNRNFWVLARNQQSKVSTDDVTITGVSVTAQDEETSEGGIAEKGETALSGKTGYVLSISGNKFVSFGTAQRVADLIAPNVVGLKFRTFSASTLGNPVMECGDAVYVTDYTANAYRSYITQLTYTVGSYESVACNAETPTHNAAINASAATKTLQETRALVANERSSREAALSRLSNQISEKAGLYQTVETLGDGSKVFYLHDAETVGRSKTIWKMNAQAIAVSVDGGKSYTSGISADGNAILNRVYAIGLNADYLNVGTIKGPSHFVVSSSTLLYNTSSYPMTSADALDFAGLTWNSSKSRAEVSSRYVYLSSNFSGKVAYPGAILCTYMIEATADGAQKPDLRYQVKKYDGTLEWRTYAYDKGVSKSGEMYTFTDTAEFADDVSEVINCGLDFHVDKPPFVLLSMTASLCSGEDKTSTWNLETGQLITDGMIATNVYASGHIDSSSGSIGSFEISDGSIVGKYLKISDKDFSAISFLTIDENGSQKKIGSIGNDFYVDGEVRHEETRGVSIDLDADTSFFSVSRKNSASDKYYKMKLAYSASEFGSFSADTINMLAPLDMHGHKITNIGGGVSAKFYTSVINDISFNDGAIHFGAYTNGCYLKFTNGILTEYNWQSGHIDKE